jgi:hypothetical protein
MKYSDEIRSLITATGNVYRQQRKMQQERVSQNEELKNHIERVVSFRNRRRARVSAREKTKARTAALVAVRKTLQQASDTNAKNIKTVFNVSLYLLLLDQDLAYFTNDLVQAIGDRRRAFIAKQEAVLLYEAAEDVRQLVGREFRAALKALNVPQEIIDRINAVSTGLNEFWDKHRAFLKTIRNVLAAHRDHDALRYVSDLESLKPLDVMNRAVEFSALLELLVQELIKISRLTSNPGVILRDILFSGARGQE